MYLRGKLSVQPRMNLKSTLIFTLTLFLPAIHSYAITPAEVKFHCESRDTLRLTEVLIDMESKDYDSKEAMVADAARHFLNTPYMAGTLEGDGEKLTVNTDEVDCTTFVEMCLALAMCRNERRSSWRDYLNNLATLRYRGGKVDGYASRLHYVSDWIVDNSHRGILTEVTDRVGNTDSKIKTLDFMSTHRSSYPALADSAAYSGIKRAEMGYRSHKFNFIKGTNVNGARLREGDVVALTTNLPGLDVTHMGIVVMKDGVPYMLHASSKEKKVTLTPYPLAEYMRRNKTQGIRVIRLTE